MSKSRREGCTKVSNLPWPGSVEVGTAKVGFVGFVEAAQNAGQTGQQVTQPERKQRSCESRHPGQSLAVVRHSGFLHCFRVSFLDQAAFSRAVVGSSTISTCARTLRRIPPDKNSSTVSLTFSTPLSVSTDTGDPSRGRFLGPKFGRAKRDRQLGGSIASGSKHRQSTSRMW